MRLDQLLAEADSIIEKRASAKPTPNTAPAAALDEETVKLASYLENFGETGEPQAEPPFEMTFSEKLASAVAIVEAINNYEEFCKVAQFREKALGSGYTEAQVDEFLEKRALQVPTSVAVPALAAIAAGVGGHLHGKKKGYDNALKDVRDAFAAQANG